MPPAPLFSPLSLHDALPICALSPSLMESEMFGHVKGAFTGADRDRPGKFAAAGHGTLLLDEVNSLPLPLQAKLVRADRKSKRLNSSHANISYAVFCLKQKTP